MKEKKLGVLHILTTYIWLPLVIVGYFYEIIKLCVYLFSDIRNNFTIDVIAYSMIIIAVFILAAFSFISMIQKNNLSVLMLRYLLVMYIADYILRGILSIQGENISLLSLPLGLIIPIGITILLWRYYDSRIQLLNNSRMGYIIANLPSIIGFYLGGCITILIAIIETYSIYWMFQISVGEGLFGLFVPVVAQIVFLFKTGFATPYANTIYGMLIIFVCIYVMAYIDNYIQNLQQKIAEQNILATRLIPLELDNEYEELTISIYKWEYELRQAQRNYSKYSTSTVNDYLASGDISDLDARKHIKYLNDNKSIIDNYPDKIETAKKRCDEILAFAHKMWPDEKFPAKTIFIPKLYMSDIEK